MEPFLTITPLGGLGEIGMNCQLWDDGHDAVLVDCGLMFPDDLQPGIDAVIPPLDAAVSGGRLRAVILTHAHEDHIGALPWLVDLVDRLSGRLSVHGSPYTIAVAKHKLEEHGTVDRIDLVPEEANRPFSIGASEYALIPVAHSIPQSRAIAADTPVGRILHTGDFKFDPTPSDGVGTDEAAIRRFAGPSGVRLLMCDSTNAEIAGSTPPERIVATEIRHILAESSGRVIVTTFSSHVERIRAVFAAARSTGREVIVSGRSLLSSIDTAREILGADLPEEPITDRTIPVGLPPDHTVVLVTGSQGESLSALSRIVRGEHGRLSVTQGDTVIMSSRVIPGNALAVDRIINQLVRLGARVIHADLRPVHVSGHGRRDDLRRMITLARPRFVLPVHGEFRHLDAARELAVECGIASSHALLIGDGQPVTLLPKAVRVEPPASAEPLLVDGKGVGDLTDAVLNDRRLLADNGVVTVALVRDAADGSLLHGPSVRTKGLLPEDDAQALADILRHLSADAASCGRNTDIRKLHDDLRSVIRSHCRRALGRDPVVIPVIMEA